MWSMVENKSPIFFRSEFMPRVGLVHTQKKEDKEKKTGCTYLIFEELAITKRNAISCLWTSQTTKR